MHMLTTLLSLFLAAISLPPKPDHYVTDRAGVIPADRAAAIDARLKSFEQSTSDQVLVYVDRKVPVGTTLEEMSAQAIHQWGVGQKGKDNGAIVFLFTDDHKMRIEVGYGLEGTLTDARAKLITSTLMKPRIKDGDYAGAVDAAVTAIMNFAQGEPYKGSGSTVAQANAAAPSAAGVLLPFLVFFGIAGFIVFMAIYGRKRGWVTVSSSSSSSSSSSDSSDSSWSSSSSSDSSSDFSGGGGDGGGGGASDSW